MYKKNKKKLYTHPCGSRNSLLANKAESAIRENRFCFNWTGSAFVFAKESIAQALFLKCDHRRQVCFGGRGECYIDKNKPTQKLYWDSEGERVKKKKEKATSLVCKLIFLFWFTFVLLNFICFISENFEGKKESFFLFKEIQKTYKLEKKKIGRRVHYNHIFFNTKIILTLLLISIFFFSEKSLYFNENFFETITRILILESVHCLSETKYCSIQLNGQV